MAGPASIWWSSRTWPSHGRAAGLPGSILLTINKGKLTIGDQGAGSRGLGVFQPPVPIPANLSAALYGTLPGEYETDTNLTPDFPSTATLLAKMYAIRTSVQLDGVISIDPVALSYLLDGAAPIDIEHGLTLTSSSITEILLSEAYKLYPNDSDIGARDLFLANATAKAFSVLTQSSGSAKAELAGSPGRPANGGCWSGAHTRRSNRTWLRPNWPACSPAPTERRRPSACSATTAPAASSGTTPRVRPP